MNTTLTTVRGRQSHPPHELDAQPHPVRRVGLVDRVALRLGIALITWSRRPLTVETRERRASRIEQQLARLAREQAAERRLRLIAPLR